MYSTASRGKYAAECALCHHLSSAHRLAADGDIAAGPYICQSCGCSTTPSDPVIWLTEAQYRSRHEGGA